MGGGKKGAWLLFLRVCATAALRRRRSLEEDALSGEADLAADHVFRIKNQLRHMWSFISVAPPSVEEEYFFSLEGLLFFLKG